MSVGYSKFSKSFRKKLTDIKCVKKGQESRRMHLQPCRTPELLGPWVGPKSHANIGSLWSHSYLLSVLILGPPLMTFLGPPLVSPSKPTFLCPSPCCRAYHLVLFTSCNCQILNCFWPVKLHFFKFPNYCLTLSFLLLYVVFYVNL